MASQLRPRDRPAGDHGPWRIFRRGRPDGAYPPMVLVHGFTGGTRSWADVVRALPAYVPVLALSVPGHHPLAPASADFAETCLHLAVQCRQATGLLRPGQVEGGQRSHLVGYSLGARLCLHLLIACPDLFGCASLIGAHPGLDDEACRRRRRADDAAWQALLRARGTDVFLRRWDAQPLFARQRQRHRGRLARQRAWRRQHDAAQLAQSLASAGLGVMPSTGPALSAVRLPVQWIVGAHDAKFLSLAAQATDVLPNATLQVLAACGHNPLMEGPAALAATLMRWYRRQMFENADCGRD